MSHFNISLWIFNSIIWASMGPPGIPRTIFLTIAGICLLIELLLGTVKALES